MKIEDYLGQVITITIPEGDYRAFSVGCFCSSAVQLHTQRASVTIPVPGVFAVIERDGTLADLSCCHIAVGDNGEATLLCLEDLDDNSIELKGELSVVSNLRLNSGE